MRGSVANLTASMLNSRLNFCLAISTLHFLGHGLIFVSTEPAAGQLDGALSKRFEEIAYPEQVDDAEPASSAEGLALLWQIDPSLTVIGHLVLFHRGARDGGVGCCTGGLAEAVR